MKAVHYLSLSFIAVAFMGCQTVASPFVRQTPNYQGIPEEALRAVALQIEQAIADGVREPAIEDRPGLVLGQRVRQTMRTRATRIGMVDELRDRGFAVEKSNGLLVVNRSRAYRDATDRRQRDRDANVVMGENDDRWALYEGLMKDNSYRSGTRGGIQRIFFEARVQVMKPGHLYESASGDLVAK